MQFCFARPRLPQLVGKMRTLSSVDTSRVYVTGLSMGGYGTWDAVQRHPDWFAAALPCCGGGDTTLAWKIRDVPIWTFHGAKDQAVPVTRSRDMVSALWAVGGNIRYREYPDLMHWCWDQTYSDDPLRMLRAIRFSAEEVTSTRQSSCAIFTVIFAHIRCCPYAGYGTIITNKR